MDYSGKWYQKAIRWIQVKWYIITGRYKPVEGGVNFYADTKKGNVGVKGYYWRPMTYEVKVDLSDKGVYRE